MSIVKSSKNKDQLLLDAYRYRRANKSQVIWRCCRNDCAGRVRFDGKGYVKVTDHVHAPNPEETISMEFNYGGTVRIWFNETQTTCQI
jgi:hypothetical protein